MKEINGLKDWVLDKKIPNSQRFVAVKISLQYPEPTLFINLKPKERIKAIDKVFKDNYQKLIGLNLFESHEIDAPKKKTTVYHREA